MIFDTNNVNGIRRLFETGNFPSGCIPVFNRWPGQMLGVQTAAVVLPGDGVAVSERRREERQKFRNPYPYGVFNLNLKEKHWYK
jgi:hypothetical protein